MTSHYFWMTSLGWSMMTLDLLTKSLEWSMTSLELLMTSREWLMTSIEWFALIARMVARSRLETRVVGRQENDLIRLDVRKWSVDLRARYLAASACNPKHSSSSPAPDRSATPSEHFRAGAKKKRRYLRDGAFSRDGSKWYLLMQGWPQD